MRLIGWIFCGVVAGTCGGLLGIGGGLIMIPLMVYVFGLTQHQAQGTSLAVMVPPVGLLAAWHYYASGHVQLAMAAYICVGFVVGGLLGAQLADQLSDLWLRRLFGAVLFVSSLDMMLRH